MHFLHGMRKTVNITVYRGNTMNKKIELSESQIKLLISLVSEQLGDLGIVDHEEDEGELSCILKLLEDTQQMRLI
jgi:hypothetical protein